MKMQRHAFVALLILAAAFAAVSAHAGDLGQTPAPAATAAYDPATLPAGDLGNSIKLGREIVMNTQVVMKGYVRANLQCASCHLEGGTAAKGGSFMGTAAYFPQYNKRSNRIITLHDRLAECFLYSMNGRPPNYASKEMVGLVAYIGWLSRGTPLFSTPSPANRFIEPLPSASPDIAHGATIYAQQCSLCHQSNGAGMAGAFPPLWGATSFNNGAGMAHIDRMTGFVMHNMPKSAPGSLSIQDSYDVSAYVLSHARPAFDGKTLVENTPLPADYY
jgi:thiosulfate dehydrogenase